MLIPLLLKKPAPSGLVLESILVDVLGLLDFLASLKGRVWRPHVPACDRDLGTRSACNHDFDVHRLCCCWLRTTQKVPPLENQINSTLGAQCIYITQCSSNKGCTNSRTAFSVFAFLQVSKAARQPPSPGMADPSGYYAVLGVEGLRKQMQIVVFASDMLPSAQVLQTASCADVKNAYRKAWPGRNCIL